MQAFLDFSANTPSGAGSLPCMTPITFHGQTIEICLADFNEELSIIGVFISAMGFLLAGLIILRK